MTSGTISGNVQGDTMTFTFVAGDTTANGRATRDGTPIAEFAGTWKGHYNAVATYCTPPVAMTDAVTAELVQTGNAVTGMHDVEIPRDQRKDPLGLTNPKWSRDPQRTPMQWDATPAAGFTCGKPWLPVSGDFPGCNVERERDDPDSLLSLYRRLIDLRRANDALVAGDYVPIVTGTTVLAWARSIADKIHFVIAVNLGDSRAKLESGRIPIGGTVAVATRRDREGERVGKCVQLDPGDAVVIRVSS